MKNQEDGGRKREEGASCVSKGFAKRNTKQWFLHLLARPSSTAALHSMRRHHHHSCVRWWQNVDQSWKTARTETHKAIVALTCPSTAALYPPCRHHYHHHRQHHHHHWWEPPSFISCAMEATLRWVFKNKCTTMLLVLTFFHSRPSLNPSPGCVVNPLEGSMQYGWWQWRHLSHHGDHMKKRNLLIWAAPVFAVVWVRVS